MISEEKENFCIIFSCFPNFTFAMKYDTLNTFMCILYRIVQLSQPSKHKTFFEKTQRTFAFHFIEKIEFGYNLLRGTLQRYLNYISVHPRWLAIQLEDPWLQLVPKVLLLPWFFRLEHKPKAGHPQKHSRSCASKSSKGWVEQLKLVFFSSVWECPFLLVATSPWARFQIPVVWLSFGAIPEFHATLVSRGGIATSGAGWSLVQAPRLTDSF